MPVFCALPEQKPQPEHQLLQFFMSPELFHLPQERESGSNTMPPMAEPFMNGVQAFLIFRSQQCLAAEQIKRIGPKDIHKQAGAAPQGPHGTLQKAGWGTHSILSMLPVKQNRVIICQDVSACAGHQQIGPPVMQNMGGRGHGFFQEITSGRRKHDRAAGCNILCESRQKRGGGWQAWRQPQGVRFLSVRVCLAQ